MPSKDFAKTREDIDPPKDLLFLKDCRENNP